MWRSLGEEQWQLVNHQWAQAYRKGTKGIPTSVISVSTSWWLLSVPHCATRIQWGRGPDDVTQKEDPKRFQAELADNFQGRGNSECIFGPKYQGPRMKIHFQPRLKIIIIEWTLVQFSHSVMSNSLRPHGLQLTRPPCPSPSSGVYSNSCPLNWWCHPTISSSVIPFSSYLQSFPASGFFPLTQLFTSSGQSIGVSASRSVLPVNTQDWSPLGWTGWISLQSKGLSRVFSNTKVQKHQFFGTHLSYSPTLTSIHDYWKNHSFD